MVPFIEYKTSTCIGFTCGGLWPRALSNVKTLSDLMQDLVSWGKRLKASLNSATCSSVKLSWTSSFFDIFKTVTVEPMKCDSGWLPATTKLLLQKIFSARAKKFLSKVASVSTDRNMDPLRHMAGFWILSVLVSIALAGSSHQLSSITQSK